MTIDLPFSLGDRVVIDNDTSLVAYVTEVSVSWPERILIECSWMHNGESKSAYFDTFRLKIWT